ncbi:2-hydroxychromene-2-carboxylate isomerase [uncultured Methylibium sp.]|uniref:2-hydroxychromene-2-carboxylate isomerase n=1 Tax=uncultured Methylibium sp. TaxID=381093 RepID=UPI0025DF68CC|nr:2-hydroxychromene-2-carboxylate isomerase [uncultured Methylibium sp.]
MTPITFWFDPISPYAHLAFEQLPQALEGCSYVVEYRPLLFAGLLKHWGQLGPAEIAPKRDWTYRQIAWLAHRQRLAMEVPAVHPFNPLPLLRLLLACADDGRPNRLQCETVLRHVWQGGAPADDAARLAELGARLQPRRDPQSDAVKQQLRENTEAAVARGVFGVPTLELPRADGGARLFWGFDALDMAAACLRGDPWFAAHWDAPAQVGTGVTRAR